VRVDTNPWTRKGTASLFALAVTAAVATACGSTSPSTSSGGCTKTFTFPLLGDQSGPIALVGQNNADAAQLKVNQINAAGGIDGYCLAFNKVDTGNQPAQAAELFRAQASSALVVVGPFSSTDAKAVAPLAVALKIPVVTPGVSDRTIIDRSRPWTFDTFIVSATSLPAGADDFISATHATRVIAITNTQDAASSSQTAIVLAEFKNKGATLVKQIDVTTTQIDFSAEAAQVKALQGQADAVLVANNPNAAGVIVKTLRSAGVTLPIDVTQNGFNPDFLTVAGATANNVYTYTQYWTGLNTPSAAKFLADFLKLSNGVQPGVTAPAAYDAVGLMADALKRSGVLTSNASLADRRAKLRDALASTTSYAGVLSTFSMGESGIRTGGGFFLIMTNGEVMQDTAVG
jgi:branched-chain amino acid transport system substrate-binding protein